MDESEKTVLIGTDSGIFFVAGDETNNGFHRLFLVYNSRKNENSYLNEYWGSVSNFLENGFGYCILHNDIIASECVSTEDRNDRLQVVNKLV